jgi:hypothetical protein
MRWRRARHPAGMQGSRLVMIGAKSECRVEHLVLRIPLVSDQPLWTA